MALTNTVAADRVITPKGRAISLATAGTKYLIHPAPVVTAKPLTLCCWFNADNTTEDHSLISLSDEAGSVNWIRLIASGDTQADRLQANIKAATPAPNDVRVISHNTFSVGQWHHGVGLFDTASTTVMLDGVANTAAETREPAGLDNTTIGVLKYTTLARYTTGDILLPEIYGRILTTAEIAEKRADPWAMYRLRAVVYPAAVAEPVLTYRNYILGGGVF